MGNLEYPGVMSSDKVIADLIRDAEAGQEAPVEGSGEGVDGELKRVSLSEHYKTPEQVLTGLIEAAHLSEDDEAVKSFARGLIEGASGEELHRFSRLVVGVYDGLRTALEVYGSERRREALEAAQDFVDKEKPGAVDVSMDRLRERIGVAVTDDNPEAEKFVGTTEGLLRNFDDIAGDLDLDWVVTKAAVLKFELEKELFRGSGVEF